MLIYPHIYVFFNDRVILVQQGQEDEMDQRESG